MKLFVKLPACGCAGMLLICGSVQAQPCVQQWQGGSLPGANGSVVASVMWDSDGVSGPLPARLVVGGSFSVLGSAVSQGVALLEANGTFSPLGRAPLANGGGAGVPLSVKALLVAQDGSLYAAGQTLDGGLSSSMYRLVGEEWQACGMAANDPIEALTQGPLGVVAGGSFTAIGGVSALHVAQWTGTSWSAMGAGLPRGVLSLITRSSGAVVAGCFASNESPEVSRMLTQWNGTTWADLPGAVLQGFGIDAMIALPNDEFIFGMSGRVNGVSVRSGLHRYSAVGVSALPGNRLVSVTSLLRTSDGSIVVGGPSVDTTYSPPFYRIGRLNGTTWEGLGEGFAETTDNRRVETLAELSNGDIVAGGNFTRSGAMPVAGIARWDGTTWQQMGNGLSAEATSIIALPSNEFVANGRFTTVSGEFCDGLARYRGGVWQPILNADSPYFAVAAPLWSFPNGDVAALATIGPGSPSRRLLRIAADNSISVVPGAGLATVLSVGAVDGSIYGIGNVPQAGAGSLVFLQAGVWTQVSPVQITQGSTRFDVLHGRQGEVFVFGRLSRQAFGLAGGDISTVMRWRDGEWTDVSPGEPDMIAEKLIREPDGSVIVLLVPATSNVTSSALWRIQPDGGRTLLARLRADGGQLARSASGEIVVNEIGPAGRGAMALRDGQLVPLAGASASSVARGFAINTRGELGIVGSFVRLGAVPVAYAAVLPAPCGCDSIDFNNDGLFPSDADLIDFFAVLAGGACSTPACNDIDFNNDGLFPDDTDLIAYLRVLAGGTC